MKNIIPWSLRGVGPFLNKYGDSFLFKCIQKTKPIPTNPNATTAIHSLVPHRYLNAYLFAIKSFLRFYNDVAVIVHDDGSLKTKDYEVIQHHLPDVQIISRQLADETFQSRVNDQFLNKVRTSYTSYLKLFDSTLFSEDKKIIILDTDTLFLKRPDYIINWCIEGGQPWYHLSPKGSWKNKPAKVTEQVLPKNDHIQALIANQIDEINAELNTEYRLQHGFCSGFIGYQANTIKFDELKRLFQLLHTRFGEKIFLWGAEQTVHGLILCGENAIGLPVDEYFVFTQNNARTAYKGTFVHFVGENRFHKLIYPKLSRNFLNELL